MYLSFESNAVTTAVKTVSSLTIPPNATHVELQASAQPCRYTMDGDTVPTQTTGMVIAVADKPKLFSIEDLRRIKFTRGSGTDGLLSLHYLAGRDI